MIKPELRRKLRRPFYLTTAFFAVLCLPVFYQNCSAPLPEDESGDLSSVVADVRFAYDERIDHISYMSCSNMPAGYDAKAFFTFKVGAYLSPNGGIRLTDSFKNLVSSLPNDEKIQALATSEANRDAYLSLGLRPSQNLQTIFQAGTMYAGDFLGQLAQPSVAQLLLDTNTSTTRINNFPALGADSKLEETIHFTQAETLASQVRTEISANGAYLAITYGRAGQDPALALSPGSPATRVYGHGYRLTYVNGAGQTGAITGSAPRVMNSAREYDLTTGQESGAIWDCFGNWNFIIVKPTDVGVRALCDNYMTEPTPAADQIELYQMLRRLLPASDWGLNLNQRCIVPKKVGACYGTANVNVNYTTGACDPITGTCPHYFSICKRR